MDKGAMKEPEEANTRKPPPDLFTHLLTEPPRVGWFVRSTPYALWGLIPWDPHGNGALLPGPGPAASGTRPIPTPLNVAASCPTS